MAELGIVRDNPVMRALMRSRLRATQMMPWVVVIGVLCLAILWAGQALNLFRSGTALSLVLGLELLILVLGGAQQVGGAVSAARESGIIDYFRVSPQPASWLTLGFFLGAPAREYVLFAVTIPFALLLAVLSPVGVVGLLQIWLAMLLCAWILQAISLLGALSSRKPKATGRGGLVGLLVLALFLGRPVALGLWFASRSLTGEAATLEFFGVPVHWLVFVVVYASVILAFLFLACVRKMPTERAHAFRKAEAVTGLGLAALMLLGAFWGRTEQWWLTLIMVYGLTLLGMVLIATATPTQAEYLRGVRRAAHQGHRRPGPWSDEGCNRLALILMGGIVLVGTTALCGNLLSASQLSNASFGLPIAVAVFTLAYFGLANQYFLWRLPASGRGVFQLLIFLLWLMPIVIGSLLAAAGGQEMASSVMLSLSPLLGIVLSSNLEGSGLMARPESTDLIRLTSILPPIALAFVFASLLGGWQRRLDGTVHGPAQKAAKRGPFDEVAANAEDE